MVGQFVEIGEMMQTPPKWFDKSCESSFVIIKHREYNSAAPDNFKKNAFSYPNLPPYHVCKWLIRKRAQLPTTGTSRRVHSTIRLIVSLRKESVSLEKEEIPPQSDDLSLGY